MGSKVWRRMEKYRLYKDPKNPQSLSPPRLLLPLSLGVSSSALLHMLDTTLNRQIVKNAQQNLKNAKLMCTLEVLVVDPSTISADQAACEKNFNVVQETFPRHTFKRVPLHSIFEYVPDMADIMRDYAGPQFVDDASRSNEERLAAFRSVASSATSRADLDSILFTRLVVGYAKHVECVSVLWGDSDSSLAAKTLAGAAKGRGASLTWQVSDGMSPWGISFDFPCRDISKPELSQYEKACPEIGKFIIPDAPMSDTILTKNMSIDELMVRYVTTQGEKYPGVMANVSRTANKLQSTSGMDSSGCSLCGGLVANVKGNETGITVGSQFKTDGPQFCYGCMRSRPEINS